MVFGRSQPPAANVEQKIIAVVAEYVTKDGLISVNAWDEVAHWVIFLGRSDDRP
jgi:hypothetical protein